MTEGDKTAITKATTTSKSLRTTIPAGIVRQFGLTKGDSLNWKMEARGGGIILLVETVKEPLKKKKDR
jgi:bifunctional DNA-binding transcriptional regulator/antitoxin component of YhaV-PrlF toxin-antitoxin module